MFRAPSPPPGWSVRGRGAGICMSWEKALYTLSATVCRVATPLQPTHPPIITGFTPVPPFPLPVRSLSFAGHVLLLLKLTPKAAVGQATMGFMDPSIR